MKADEDFIRKMLEDEKKASALEASVFMCPICRDSVPIDGCVTLSCEHRYCVDCFAGYVESKISEKAVTEASLRCAIPGCTTSITAHVRFRERAALRCYHSDMYAFVSALLCVAITVRCTCDRVLPLGN
jgi:hypothetical protein